MSIDVFPATVLNSTLWNGQTYEEGTFTVTATGFSGTAPSGTARYVRVGKQVTLQLPTLTSNTSNATTFTVTGLPAALYPWVTLNCVAPIIDNGVDQYGTVNVTTAGVINVYKAAWGAFTASGQKTLYPVSLVYIVP